MYLGFRQGTESGTSIGINDFVIPEEKKTIIGDSVDEVKDIEKQIRKCPSGTLKFKCNKKGKYIAPSTVS